MLVSYFKKILPNTYFNFKQFTIHQDACAMKVCTDACILGAFTASKISNDPEVKTILDIGCGTGLLSLMLAQQTSACIDAVEIEPGAALQAKRNVSETRWKNQFKIINVALQDFRPAHKYDLIICNPPFYEDDLKSPDEKKNVAKHDSTFRLDSLTLFIKQHLTPRGFAAILLPIHRVEYFLAAAQRNELYLAEKLLVKQTPAHDFFRAVIFLTNQNTGTPLTSELLIHDNNRNYSPEFKRLMKDYYLNF